MKKRAYLVRTHIGLKYVAFAYTRRHAVAETLLAMIRDGEIKLLDVDPAVVTRWSVERCKEEVVMRLAAELGKEEVVTRLAAEAFK